MNAWFIASLCGIVGGLAGELLELSNSLQHQNLPPWLLKHGRRQPLGLRWWSLLVAVNLVMGGLAGAAVYGQMAAPVVSPHLGVTLGAAGLAAPAVLQKLGRAIRT